MADQRCGTCKHFFITVLRSDPGQCWAPVPWWVKMRDRDGHMLHKVSANDGDLCPLHQPKDKETTDDE